MTEFNLEEAMSGQPVCTRDGRNVTILKWDLKNKYPICGYIQDENNIERVMCWTKSGKCHKGVFVKLDDDLMMGSGKHEGWVNIFRVRGIAMVGKSIFESEKEAKEIVTQDDAYRVGTIHIEW